MELMPEFFVFLGVDLFVAMSLLTCLLDNHYPKTLPYIFQAAAIGGYVHIFISKDFLGFFGEDMRFWYCFIYLTVALGNIIALNVYLAVIKKQWAFAKVFAGAVVFPSLLISVFFLSNYVSQTAGVYLFPMAMLFSALVLGLSTSVFLSPRIKRKFMTRR